MNTYVSLKNRGEEVTLCIPDDLAYLLGLICGRGEISAEQQQISIEFPFKSEKVEGITLSFNQRDAMIIGLDDIVNRLSDLIGKHVMKISGKKSIKLVVSLRPSSITWQSINLFFEGKSSSKEFCIPDVFYSTQTNTKVNFLRGLADSAGFITKGSYDRNKRYRICYEIPFSNWELSIQVCRLLQDADINVPVESVLWGHPNTRGASGWAKEHQIRVYADEFLKIGFSVDYKNQLLKDFSNSNISKLNYKPSKFCNPLTRTIRKIKPASKDEGSSNICHTIRGKHFDSFWQICRALGCKQCRS